MTTPNFDAEVYFATLSATIGLHVDEAWLPGIHANLQAVKRAADLVLGLDLGDHAEPAPVFEAMLFEDLMP